MFDCFKKLKLASAFLGVDSPAANAENLDIAELFGRLSLKDLRGMTLQADKLLEQPRVRALYESRYLPPPEPLDKLTDLGEGTLGCEYARYLRYHKLAQRRQPDGLDLGDANIYLTQRVRVTHPILHVVTEYDASPLGELALQAYYVGQLDNLMSGVIISSVLLQITRESPAVAGRIKSLYAQYWLTSKSLGLTRENIELSRRLEQIAQARYAGGLAAQQDAIRAQVERSAMDGELVGMESEQHHLMAFLNAILARPANAPLAEPEVLRPLPARIDPATLNERLQANNPQLAIEAARVAGAEKSRDLAYRNRFPDFIVGVQPMLVGDRIDAWTVMLELNIPLQQGARRRGPQRYCRRTRRRTAAARWSSRR